MKLKIALFTLVEVGAVSALLFERFWLMVVLVALGFFVEHVISWNAGKGRGLFDLSGAPIVEIAIVAAIESAIWIYWLRLAETQTLLAGIVLFGGLLVGHVLERNVRAGLPLLRNPGRRVRESLDFTILETVTGIGWLALLGVNHLLAVAVLAVGLFVEHSISLRREVRA